MIFPLKNQTKTYPKDIVELIVPSEEEIKSPSPEITPQRTVAVPKTAAEAARGQKAMEEKGTNPQLISAGISLPETSSSDRVLKEEKFATRARALFFTRLAFLTIGLVMMSVPQWAQMLSIGGYGSFIVFFGMLGYSIANFLVLPNARIGKIVTFVTLCMDLIVAVYLIGVTGGMKSPLLATQLTYTVLFALLFPKPLAILPPLLTLPVVAKIDQILGIRAIGAADLMVIIWYSALNFIIVYVMVYLHEREDAAQMDILALARDLQGLAVTEERNRLSRDIHDGLGAALSSLIIQAEYIEGLAQTSELKSEIAELKSCAEDSIDELRRALRMMRADFELCPALEDYCTNFGNRSRMPVEFIREGVPRAMKNDVQLTIFRVLQEALNNARKHAEAKSVQVRISFGESALSMKVSDDGKGFDTGTMKRGHYGLMTMKERASKVGGSAEIESSPGKGTRVLIEIPYLAPESPAI